MNDRIRLDPLVNQLVILKLRGQDPMESTILSYDDGGYWVKGGTLVDYLSGADMSDTTTDVRYL